jgi:ACR3 family arsenite efflux pump ArsB
MQIVLVFIAAVLGLTYGQNSDGLVFSSKICLFAGITMIMPTLFHFKIKDIKLVLEHKKIFLKGLLINFIVMPALAVAIGLLTNNFGIAAGIFLLSVLSGGGMVMHWIKKTDANSSLGFLLLFVNIIFISLSLLMLHFFGIYTEDYFGEIYADQINLTSFARAVIEYLIVIPFILSRVIIFAQPVVDFINKHRPVISNVSIFIIITYLFALQNSKLLFEVYDFQPELITVSIVAILAFYIGNFIIAKLSFNTDIPEQRSAFWFTTTRYITLALIIASFSINSFGVTMIIPIMFAYVIQIPIAIVYAKLLK